MFDVTARCIGAGCGACDIDTGVDVAAVVGGSAAAVAAVVLCGG
jgi:hypothetical protein